jgi:uncharacterized repeat protein (TIGR01451 family)/fimbrial isopeptide formation D2 family protein
VEPRRRNAAQALRGVCVSVVLAFVGLLPATGLQAQSVANTATVAAPDGVSDPQPGNNTATDSDAVAAPEPELTLTKAAVGTFTVGINGVYRLTLTNTSAVAATAGTITVVDTLPAGLTYVSAAGSGWSCSAAGQVVTCTTGATIAPGTAAPDITLTVAVAVAAAPSVINVARASGGGDTACPASGATQARCNPSVTTPVSAAASVDFCPANTVWNVTQSGGTGGFYRYSVGAATDVLVPELNFAVAGNLNGLMVDPVRNRLLFISYSGGQAQLWAYDAANGGWYAAAPPMTIADIPRAGMTPAGVGYLLTGDATPAVYRVDASGAFNYTITPAGTLTYDFPPSDPGSGDIAFDAGGNGWMAVGLDIYKINFSGANPVAVRQQRPLLNGSPSGITWAGVAFGTDGDLYVATNASPSRYFRLDLGAGTLSEVANTAANQARDLGSCAFPAEPQPARLQVAKTLSMINGVPAAAGATIKAGDVLTYDIDIEHVSGDLAATLFPGDIVDSPLPANTTYVAAGNDFTCAGSSCSNTNSVNVAAGTTQTLHFVARVDDPLPANLASITNAVTVKGVDCAVGGNKCTETTQVAPVVTVAKASDPATGATVNPGQEVEYTLTVTVANAATTGVVTLEDTLSGAQTFSGTPTVPTGGNCAATGSTMRCTLAAGSAPNTYQFRYTATVDAAATGTIGNSVVPSGDDTPSCAANACQTEHPIVDTAVTVAKTSNPATGTAVSPGTEIEYTLTVTVANSATTDVVRLDDTLTGDQAFTGTPVVPAGGNCAPSATTMQCTLQAGSLPGTYVFRYRTLIDATATGALGNDVEPSGDDTPTCAPGACGTTHTIVPAAVTVAKASNPASGSIVNPGTQIEYTLTVTVANSVTTDVVRLEDTLTGAQSFTGTPVVPAGGSCTPSGNTMGCTLAAGSAPGTYVFRYLTEIGAAATGALGNNVVPSGGDTPTCVPGACGTTHTITASAVTVNKSSNPGSGAVVNPGSEIEYTLTVVVANSATTDIVTVEDTLTGAQSFTGTPVVPAGGNCTPSGNTMECTLQAGTLPGTYEFRYRTLVAATATGALANNIVPSGGDDPTCGSCGTTHSVVPAVVTVAKTSNPGNGSVVDPGDEIEYTVTVTVANSATTGVVRLDDTLTGAQSFTGTPTLPAGGSCTPSGNAMQCTLAAGSLPGTYEFRYRTTVGASATGTLGNNVAPSGPDDPSCTPGACATTHPVVPTAVAVSKSSNPASGTQVAPGDTITYTLTVNVANSATTGDVTLTDTLSPGQALGSLPSGCSASGQVVTCVLPAGSLPNAYTFVYTATVDANATGTIGNTVVPSGPDDPACAGACDTTHTIVPTEVTVSKVSNPASGTQVEPGDTITYTLTATVANSATTAPVTLTDTLSAGQTLGTMPSGCAVSGQVVTCTLPAGSLPNTYTFVYTATVDSNATGSVSNAVVPSGPDAPVCAPNACETEHPIVPTAVTVSKSANPASGTQVEPGDTITYTLTATVANSATTADVVLTDTLSAGQALGTLPSGCTAAGQVATCTLPAGSLPNTYTFVYTATVNADATGDIGNVVVPSGTDNPTCQAGACATEHSIVPTRVTVAKSSDPASGSPVNANATINYVLTVTVENSATTSPVVLTDTLSGAQSFTGTPSVPAGGACSVAGNAMECTLATGALPGVYEFRYGAVVAAAASGTVGNTVAATGGGDDDPVCTTCSTEHPIAAPVVEVGKVASPGDGATVNVGDTIEYTLTVTVENAALIEPVTLTDTPGAGLTIGALPQGCAMSGSNVLCTLPAGTVPGSYTFVYPATINADASDNVSNTVAGIGGGGAAPGCSACVTRHQVVAAAQLRIVKQANPRDARIGDLVRYTLTIENVGPSNVTDATLIDTPPPGFSFVADSLTVADADGAGRLVGTYPIRVDRLDVRTGEHATVQYLLRVGAGVRPGMHVNRVHAEDGGRVISNEATAEVQLVADPLIEESLLLGTVYDDRDGDGWQDSAKLTGVRVQGGFAPGAYVAQSSSIDHGRGPQPLPDASAPLLHGVDVGAIAGRQSEAAPVDAHTVTVSQTLASLDFTGDFVLTSDQGVTVRMDAAGATRVERTGDAAKGLTSAEPRIERRVSRVDGGYRVDYVVGNAGIDEHGIPGVRIASVEGLLIETDQYGRYHLEGVQVGSAERGNNFVLKVDPATLPPGTVFTTDNPLVRRITQGLPVRFDFGAKLPSGLVEGGRKTVEMQLGEVMFDPGSAALRAEDAPVVVEMAEQVRAHGGGEVVIAASGDQALAYDRAQAVRAALIEELSPEQARAVSVELRRDPDDPASTLVSIDESQTLGTILFDTDSAAIKAEYMPLIARIAAEIERMQGGVVSVTGHADPRGSDTYNTALGLRRAQAVFEAISAKLGSEARARLRVELRDEPAASVGTHGR